jgi:hypothetical protein
MTEFVMWPMHATIPVHIFLFVHLTLKLNDALWVDTRQHAASMRRITNIYTVVVGRFQEKKYQEPERGWSDNIKMNLKRKSLNDVQWIQLAQDMYQGPAVVKAGINFQVLCDTNKSTWIAEQLSEFLGRLFQIVSTLLR